MGNILPTPCEPRFVIGSPDRVKCLEVVNPSNYGSILALKDKDINNRYQKCLFKKTETNSYLYWRLDDYPQPQVSSNGTTIIMPSWGVSDIYHWKLIFLEYKMNWDVHWSPMSDNNIKFHRDNTENKVYKVLLLNKASGYLIRRNDTPGFISSDKVNLNSVNPDMIWEMEYVCSALSACQIVTFGFDSILKCYHELKQ
ncbi:Hypothetical protein HVR_LOCUS932 [uncultured virus]|nr:Hypothetical protein HVR_LOCUS932 [uncultured virus]